MKLLLVEDDAEMASLIVRFLSEEGFEVDADDDGAEGLRMALERDYCCVLLDLMLPTLDGVSLCQELRRQNRHMPVIMLTARKDVEDRVGGLAAGADDYVTKPFEFDELLARIRAQVRRNEVFSSPDKAFGGLVIDHSALAARCDERQAELTPKELQLLEYFIDHAGEVISAERLHQDVWGQAFDPKTNVLNVYLFRLRKKLEDLGAGPRIETIRGRGYSLRDE